MGEGPRRRLRLVSIMLAGFVLVLLAQLVQVQIINHGFYSAWALEQYEQQVIIVEPPRGMVRDRNGYLLAGNSVMYSIEADTRYVKDVEELAAELDGYDPGVLSADARHSAPPSRRPQPAPLWSEAGAQRR